MSTVTSTRVPCGLLANIAVPVVATLVINGLIFAVGWDSGDQARVQPEFAPPGWVVGAVWVVLFALMGAARYYAASDKPTRHLIEVLIGACALYPFYTGGLEQQAVALSGTIVTFAIVLAVVIRARIHAPRSAILVTPVVLWTIFAAALIVREIQLN